jgi:hypothetical protein
MAGSWNLKFTLCCTDKSLTTTLRQSSVQWKITDISTSFIWIIIFFNRAYEYGNDEIFKLLRWMQNLNHWLWYHGILYAHISSEDEQLLIRPLLQKNKHTNMAGQLKFRIHILFYGDHSWTTALQKRSVIQWKIMDIPTSFIWFTTSFNGASEYSFGQAFKLLRWMQNLHQST